MKITKEDEIKNQVHEDEVVLRVGNSKSTLIDTKQPEPEETWITAYVPRITFVDDFSFRAINAEPHIKTSRSGLILVSDLHKTHFNKISLTEFYERLMMTETKIYIANQYQYFYMRLCYEKYPYIFNLRNSWLTVTRKIQNERIEIDIIPLVEAEEVRWKFKLLKTIH